jgi:glycosyltransferase involved in cell wall biosynthesis
MNLSVIICSHNPRPDYLQRVLDALKAQTLPAEQWELLLIDNASKEPLVNQWDLSWHPHARHVREEELGLTPARLRGIKESQAERLVFVDDDNVLRFDYLINASQIMRENPLIGALGAGRILPEFETTPAPDTIPFLNLMALRNHTRSYYSNEMCISSHIPWGAGLCIARRFAQSYFDSCQSRSLTRSLDRKGKELLSGGDIDLVFHACHDGFIAGTIPQLELLHLIPSFRMQPDYLVKIVEGNAKSTYHLSQIWGRDLGIYENPILKRLRCWRTRLRLKGLGLRIFLADQRAKEEARKSWRSETINKSNDGQSL